MADPSSDSDVPIFPLNTVLFPDGLLPLRVFEARYMDMVRNALKQGSPFGVCLIREGSEAGAPAVPETIGTLARITECDMQQLGVLLLKVRGAERFSITAHHAGAQGLILADIERLVHERDAPVPPELAPCERLLRAIVQDNAEPIFYTPFQFESASWVGYRLAEILPLPLPMKQKLLELDDGLARLEILFQFLKQRGLILKD
jgi:Lon protease-like protein